MSPTKWGGPKTALFKRAPDGEKIYYKGLLFKNGGLENPPWAPKPPENPSQKRGKVLTRGPFKREPNE